MMKRSAIFCMALVLLAGSLGCEATSRYKVLCLVFDGVPPPPGVVPCDSYGHPLSSAVASGRTDGRGQEAARQYTAHGPYAARLCEGCHQRQTNKLLMAAEDLCLNCHDLSIKKRKTHGPVASGSCVICHDPHGSGNKYLLVAKSQEFCLHCHQKEDILKSDAHKDIDEGCTTCHNAHASDNDYLLISSAAERYKAKRQTPPQASRPKKEQASGAKQGQPTTSSTKQGQPTTSSTKQGQPTTSSTKQGQPTTSSTKQGQPSTSSTKQGSPSTSSTKQGQPSTSSTKQGSPSTSSGLVPEKSGKLPTSSRKPPVSPGAGLDHKRVSQNVPVTQSAGRQIELSEATQKR